MAQFRTLLMGLALTGSALAVVPAPASAKRPAACHQPGTKTRTLVENRLARVFVEHSDPDNVDLVGCWKRTGREQYLAERSSDDYGSDSFGLVTLRGRFVAHYSESSGGGCKGGDCPSDYPTSSSSVDVTDLRSAESYVVGMMKRPAGNRLLLDARGAIAWPVRRAQGQVEIRVRDAEGARTIDIGAIEPSSMRLSSRGLLRWTGGAQPKSMRLKHTASLASALSSPVRLSAAADRAGAPQVAVDPAGGAVVVWQRYARAPTKVQAAVRPAGGFFSRPVDVSGPGVSGGPDMFPQVATGPASDAIVVWQRNNRGRWIVEASVRVAGGSFSKPIGLSAASGSDAYPQVAMNRVGEAVAVWKGRDGVRASVRPAGAAFSAPVVLSTAGQRADYPQVAMDETGTAIVVWECSDGGTKAVQAAVRPAGGAFAAPVVLSAPGQAAEAPRVAMGAAGDAVAVWQRSDVVARAVQAAVRPVNGSFSAPADLSAPGQEAVSPRVAMGRAGEATVVWRSGRGFGRTVQAAIRSAGGSFSPPVSISGADRNATAPDVAMSDSGDAAVVWSSYDGGQYIVQLARRRAGTPFAAPADASATRQQGDVPQAAFDQAGNATAVWARELRTGPPVQATAYNRLGTPIALAGLAGLRVSPVVLRRGAQVSYGLAQAATVRFTVQRSIRGRLVGTRCAKMTSTNRRRRSCTRFVPIGRSFTRTRPAGPDRFTFTSRLIGRSLTAGRHRLIAAPTTNGRTAMSALASFRIAR